jgi:hypothetical protein
MHADGPRRSASFGDVWQLWRQDDHGNEFLVAEFTDRESAERARDEFVARGHHQHYWVVAPA